MTPKFRILALAAIGWGAAVSVQAAPVDFEALAARALADTDNGTRPKGKPLDLMPGSSQVPGFSFKGATVYHVDQTIASGQGPKDPSHAGFIQSRDAAGEKFQAISVTLAGDFKKGSIDAISYDVAAHQWLIDLLLVDTDKKEFLLRASSPTEPSFNWRRQQTIDLTQYGLGSINRIDFVSRFDSVDAFSAIALDNLNFTLSGIGGGGGTVPEPASLALVMFALAGVGFASRHRRA